MNSGVGAVATTSAASTIPLPVNAESSATSVFEINPLRDPRWEGFVNSHPRSSVFHSTNWLRALQTAYGYDPLVVTTCSPDAALTNGMVFCRVNSWLTGRRFVSLPFSDHCEPLVSNSNEFDNLLVHMMRHVDAGKWKYIEIRPSSFQPRIQGGFVRGAAYKLHSLDLRMSGQGLFDRFHKDCVQRKIRRAEREKLHYYEGNSERLLLSFYDLLMITRRRQCLPPQPLSWFRQLLASFGGDLKIRVATKDGLPVASILTLAHKKTMVYKYGCSDERFHKFGGMVLLFWNAIQEAKDKGFEEFEMGRSDNDNLGLISFKEHWGAVGTELRYWRHSRQPETTGGNWEKSLLRKLVPLTPDSVLRAVGGLLYKHVG
jgi:CelD/BcsL family acetyltransferase involved in cellulose biosynthesis